ncbi:hypothetical protein GDO78_008001 [Eleutherodactylus coqui]|uniref:Uncharacterized protein n=1 Tax=Eleutherodactylus coqui TaxID=57060 RepID=A0A8J6K8H5_ELECQ|nr:hypothetical protein GDO78_008001 [Eleutherodactylus coqui]
MWIFLQKLPAVLIRQQMMVLGKFLIFVSANQFTYCSGFSETIASIGTFSAFPLHQFSYISSLVFWIM